MKKWWNADLLFPNFSLPQCSLHYYVDVLVATIVLSPPPFSRWMNASLKQKILYIVEEPTYVIVKSRRVVRMSLLQRLGTAKHEKNQAT